MKLKSFGCSFIWGSHMPDEHPNYSRLTYPALLAQSRGWDYECYARPGSGNLMIAESVLAELAEPAVFVINWTFIDRFDYTTTDGQWQTVRPGNQDSVSDLYYRHLHSQYRDKLTTLLHIKTVADQLEANGVPYLMTYMDPLIFETEWHTNAAIEYLQNSIRSKLKDWDGKNLVDYSRDRGHKFDSSNHPLESAHRDLFEYTENHFNFV